MDTSAYAYLNSSPVFCPEKHCINYVDLKDSVNVSCSYGSFENPWKYMGVQDFGPENKFSRHTVNWDPDLYDPRTCNQLPLVPDGELASIRLGNWNTGAEAESVSYTYVADVDNAAILLLKYAIVMEDPSHKADEQPRFTLEILGEDGSLISPTCGMADFYADAQRQDATWHTCSGAPGSSTIVSWKEWTTIGLNLAEVGVNTGDMLTIRLTTYDCDLSGHFGYAYFTLGCAAAKIHGTSCGNEAVLSVAAPEVIIKSGKFSLSAGADGYRAVYNSLDLAPNKEMIMYKKYVYGTLAHATQDYCCGSTITNGMSKAAFNSYLMADGKLPDGNDKGKYKHIKTWNDTLESKLTGKKDSVVIRHKGYMDISEVLAVRDPRLAQQVDADLRFVGCGRVRYEGMPGQDGAAENTSSTGYGILKFDEPNTIAKNRQATNGNETDGPIFWLGLILINHAEACAELGMDAEATASINLLRARAGMPTLQLQGDPANNMGVSDLIWEVRRERRVELMFDKNDRYWSLIRWHQLDKLDTKDYPAQTLGAWIDMSDERMVSQVDTKNVTVNADGYIDCSINTKGEFITRDFDEKHYLAPIPSGQISLNPNLGQNPGW